MSNWLGGPNRDASKGNVADQGGYVFFETSLLAAPAGRIDEAGQNAYLASRIMGTTGAAGKCLSFSYQVDGLSSSGLRVSLQPLLKDGRLDGFHRILWMTKDRTSKSWMESHILYTYNKDHQIVFEGIAKDFLDPFRKFRGYVAVDNVALKNGLECRGHCTFEGGFCGWINEENDDFNWSLITMTGKVGKNNLGDIAVDDISLNKGSCPTAPQIAATVSGDCTFEVDECGWSNIGSRERLDDIDWERASGAALRNGVHDHTLATEKGYLMTLSRAALQRPGNRAWFTSRDFRIMPPPSQLTSVPKCVSFWYMMNEPIIDSSGPSLGTLSVYTKINDRDNAGDLILKPLWRLYNHQGPDWQYAQALIKEPGDTVVIEGIWGSSRANGLIAFDDITFFGGSCTTLPKGAIVRPGDCRFERNMCDWTNATDKSMTAWRLATVTRRPANLADKTFGSPDGYIYYDLFNQNLGINMVKLISSLIPATGDLQLCFSFWYAAFGAGDIALMQISKQDNITGDGATEKLWSLEAKNMDTTRPMWSPAQVTVDSSKDFHIVMEGQATNGGFAVDDITFTPGACPTRPEKAATGLPIKKS